jgi:hypothetical protein
MSPMRTISPTPTRMREPPRLSMLGAGGARRSFGIASSSGLRVRSSICSFVYFKSIRIYGCWQVAANENSLMIEPAGRSAKISCTAENYSKINESAKNRTGPVEPPSLSAAAAGTARCPSPVPAASVTVPAAAKRPSRLSRENMRKINSLMPEPRSMRMPRSMLSRLRLSARVAAAARNLSPALFAWVRGWCPSPRRAPESERRSPKIGSGGWSASFPRRSTAKFQP